MTFKSLATGAMLTATGFVLGAVYSNWTYDYYMLWVSPTPPEMLEKAIQHYENKARQPVFLHHVLHAVFLIGGMSALVKLYKPTESNKLFDGASLALFFFCVVFYITNLLPASYSLTTGDWVDIDAETGVKMISASQVLMVLAVAGVLLLQYGQWWAADADAIAAAKEAASAIKNPEAAPEAESAKSSSVAATETTRKRD